MARPGAKAYEGLPASDPFATDVGEEWQAPRPRRGRAATAALTLAALALALGALAPWRHHTGLRLAARASESVMEASAGEQVLTIQGVKVRVASQVVAGDTSTLRTWIVKLPADWSDAQLASMASSVPAGCEVLDQGHPSERGLAILVLRSTLATLEEVLRQNPGVVDYAEEDEVVTVVDPVEDGVASAPAARRLQRTHERFPASWGLDRIDQRYLPLDALHSSENRGEGAHVYVFDTGILYSHMDFEGRARPAVDYTQGAAVECMVTNFTCAVDRRGHGTHVAGTVGGRRYGVAKGATLHGMKVLGDSGSGYWSWFISAVDWVIVNGERPAIIQASLSGTGQSWSVRYAVERATAAGVPVVVAAGNNNYDACQRSPAYVPDAITVGSTTASDQRSSFSNYGACVDLFAPGSSIMSDGVSSDTAVASMSGTSMAAPHVAGIVAQLLSKSPLLSPAEVAQLLQASATPGVVKEPQAGSPNLLLFGLFNDPVVRTPDPPCTEGGAASCLESKCCADPSMTCFSKDASWASCMTQCVPGIHTTDPPEYQTPWSCAVLTPTTSGSATTSASVPLTTELTSLPPTTTTELTSLPPTTTTELTSLPPTMTTELTSLPPPTTTELTSLPPTTTSKQCAANYDDCLASKCCADPASTCFRKNEYWAGCHAACEPGLHDADPPEYQTPWSCEILSVTTSSLGTSGSATTSPSTSSASMTSSSSTAPLVPTTTSAQCAVSDQDCSGPKCCAEPGMTCYEKDQYWAACLASCVRGVHPDDPPAYQTPWSCSVLTNECAEDLVESCLDTKCCKDPASTCYKKDDYWASCMPACAPGLHDADPPGYKTPWSCEPLSTPQSTSASASSTSAPSTSAASTTAASPSNAASSTAPATALPPTPPAPATLPPPLPAPMAFPPPLPAPMAFPPPPLGPTTAAPPTAPASTTSGPPTAVVLMLR